MSLLLAAAAILPVLTWEGRAVVHDGNREIAIAVQTRMERDRIVSESWPQAEGEDKGLRRLIIPAEGDAILERGGKTTRMPPAFAIEERAQFAFYRQLQIAVQQCALLRGRASRSAPVIVIDQRTAFRCQGGQVQSAANWVLGEGTPIRQEFRIVGLLRSAGSVFPRRLEIRRGGKPFFDLDVTRFRSEKLADLR